MRRRHIYTQEDMNAHTTIKAVKYSAFAILAVLLLLIVVGKGGLVLDLIGLAPAIVEGVIGK